MGLNLLSTHTGRIRGCIRNVLTVATVALSYLNATAGPYQDFGPSVIQVHVYPVNKSSDYDSRATGFIVSPDGLVMTAGHVIPNKELFEEGQLWIEGRFPKLKDQAMVAEDPPLKLVTLRSSTTPHDVALLRIIDPPEKVLR